MKNQMLAIGTVVGFVLTSFPLHASLPPNSAISSSSQVSEIQLFEYLGDQSAEEDGADITVYVNDEVEYVDVASSSKKIGDLGSLFGGIFKLPKSGTRKSTTGKKAAGLRTSGKCQIYSGKATLYGTGSGNHGDGFAGQPTASGEIMNPKALTAAMRSPVPLGSCATVTAADDGKSVKVKINDRGPFGDAKKVIDLSPAAARAMRMSGLEDVTVKVCSCK